MKRRFARPPHFPPGWARKAGMNCLTPVDTFSSSKQVNYWVYDFIKTYLYALYSGILLHPDMKLDFFNAMASAEEPVLTRPRTAFQTEAGLVRIMDSFIYARIKYADAVYCASIIRIMMQGRMVHEIVVSGATPEAKRPDALRDLLIHEAINESMYKGRILRVVEAPADSDDEDPMDLEVEIVKDLGNSALENVFLPAAVSRELRQFIETVGRYSELKMSMRYILSGPPGTAKTQIVRSIAKACEGKATIILASGGDARLNMLFSFANIFSPAILGIDDLDLIVGDRNQMNIKNVLGTFLQKLDGFVENHVFVLATTNDKAMLDMAASRPGRFDQVINVGALEPKNYLDLVNRRTDDAEIIKLFEDGDVLALLREKEVVGAFLSNLVKQAVLRKRTNGREGLDKAELLGIINRTYSGFYQAPSNTSVGFSAATLEEVKKVNG